MHLMGGAFVVHCEYLLPPEEIAAEATHTLAECRDPLSCEEHVVRCPHHVCFPHLWLLRLPGLPLCRFCPCHKERIHRDPEARARLYENFCGSVSWPLPEVQEALDGSVEAQ